MTCGKCMHCRPEGVCGGCLCDALDIEVSKDDDVRFYCERYEKEAGCFYGMMESEIIWKVKNAGGKIEN